MIQSIGQYTKGLKSTPISIYVDKLPAVVNNPFSQNNRIVAFVKYGNLASFINGSGFGGVNSSHSIRLSNGIVVAASYPIHQDQLQISFHNGSSDVPPFYVRTFNLG